MITDIDSRQRGFKLIMPCSISWVCAEGVRAFWISLRSLRFATGSMTRIAPAAAALRVLWSSSNSTSLSSRCGPKTTNQNESGIQEFLWN